MSCGESTPVGSGLLDQDDLSVDFTDDIALKASQIAAQPVVTYTDLNFFNTAFLLGELNDPVFGFSKSSMFFEARPPLNNPPDFSRARLDSLVLVLEFSETGYYGDQELPHQIEVFRMTERIDHLDTIFSNQSFTYDPTPVGVKENYINRRFDSILIFDPSIDTTRFVSNVLRIPLDQELGKELINNQDAHSDTDVFLDLLNGLHVQSNVDGSSMFSFDFSSNSLQSNMELYYRIGMDTLAIYNYPLNSNRSTRTTYFEHDYAGTDIEQAIALDILGDEPMFLQGMEGVNARMDLGGVKDLDNIFINHAELELFIAQELLGDTTLFSLAERIGVMRMDENGLLVVVDDLFTGIVNNGLDRFYGGAVELDETLLVQKYSINLTDHVKQIYNNTTSSEVYITVFDKAQHPERIIVFGPEHSIYPAKLCVTFTNP